MTVLGLGRLGAPVARRLAAAGFGVTGWSRSGRAVDGVRGAADCAEAVRAAEVVLLVLFDGAACAEVLAACTSALPAGATVLNLSTVSPEEAAAFGRQLGDRYLHCPVLGSGPAARAGTLTLLVGAPAVPEAADAVLSVLGEPLPCGDATTAAALKLVANGALADALVGVGRALARAGAAALDPDVTLDVLERTALGGLVKAKRDRLAGSGAAADFAAGALRKDAALLADLVPEWSSAPAEVLPETVPGDADIAELARAYARGPASVDAAARLFAHAGVERHPALLAPLIAYARGHATGRPEHFRAAFRPTAHVEGLRDGRFVSWDLAAYCANFDGSPAPDEAGRRRTVLELRRQGTIAAATMLLEHGADTFVDAFLLVHEDGEWRIANKAYDRRS